MRRAVTSASRSVPLHRVVHQAFLPFQFVTSGSRSLMLMSRRGQSALHGTLGTPTDDALLIPTLPVGISNRTGGRKLLPCLRPPAPTFLPGSHRGVSGGALVSSSSGRGRSSFRSSLSAHLRLDIHGTRLTQVDLVSACSKESCVIRHMIMAPAGPLTLLHEGLVRTSRCCRLHAARPKPLLPTQTMGSTLQE